MEIKNFRHLKSIDKDTQVTIKCMGMTITGNVISANNWEYTYIEDQQTKEDWYIELRDTNGTYRYWKQGQDGGQLVSVEGEEAR